MILRVCHFHPILDTCTDNLLTGRSKGMSQTHGSR